MSKYSAKLATEECVAIKNTAEGETIAVSDSADAKLRGLHLYGKTTQQTTNGYQLFDAKSLKLIYGTSLDVTGDGYTVTTVSGTEKAYDFASYDVDVTALAGKTLYFAFDNIKIGLTGKVVAQVEVRGTNSPTTYHSLSSSVKDRTITIPDDVTLILIKVYSNASGTVLAEQNTTSLEGLRLCVSDIKVPWEPYTGGEPAPNVNYPQALESIGDSSSVAISAHRYQLFDADKIPSAKIRGVTLTNNGDGSFSFSGTPTKAGQSVYTLSHAETVALLKAGHIMLTDYFGNTSTNPYVYMKLSYNNEANSVEINMSKADMATIEITQDMLDDESCYAVFGIYISTKMDITNTTIKPMIYQDGDGIWEPSTPSILTISTPNGLPGVPVSSDGNYTDASGQQWACDEVDFDREVYVQRVYTYEVTGDENWTISPYQDDSLPTRFDCSVRAPIPKGELNGTAVCLCSHLACRTDNLTKGYVWLLKSTPNTGLRIRVDVDDVETELRPMLKAQYEAGTPLTVIYELETPIETPLSDEEIAAYKALRTNKPNTSIHNSENAHMAVDYVADTKNYIDNKINKAVAELSAAILTQ